MAVSWKGWSLFQLQGHKWVRIERTFCDNKKVADKLYKRTIDSAAEHGIPPLEVRRSSKKDKIVERVTA